jgi:hypothetical protein
MASEKLYRSMVAVSEGREDGIVRPGWVSRSGSKERRRLAVHSDLIGASGDAPARS